MGTLKGIIYFWPINAEGNQAKDWNPPEIRGRRRTVCLLPYQPMAPQTLGVQMVGGAQGRKSGCLKGRKLQQPTTRKLGWMGGGALETAGQ